MVVTQVTKDSRNRVFQFRNMTMVRTILTLRLIHFYCTNVVTLSEASRFALSACSPKTAKLLDATLLEGAENDTPRHVIRLTLTLAGKSIECCRIFTEALCVAIFLCFYSSLPPS